MAHTVLRGSHAWLYFLAHVPGNYIDITPDEELENGYGFDRPEFEEQEDLELAGFGAAPQPPSAEVEEVYGFSSEEETE